jgi:DNA-binding response OmpR family regulator
MMTLMADRPGLSRILFVDDDMDIARTFKLGLERNGFAVDAFTDPVKALSMARSSSYDLAILDIQMPSMNGFELYRALRGFDSKVAVLFLTAFEMPEEKYNGLASDEMLKGLLKKPLTISELVGEVRKNISVS